MPVTRTLFLRAAPLGLAAALAGCGGGTTAAPSPSGASTAAAAATSAATTSAAATSTAATTAPTSATSPSASCGVDLDSKVVGAAIMAQPIEPITSGEWDTTPLEGTFDPCLTLSVVIITVQGATGSSPDQALLFHQGQYVGVTSAKAHPFMTVNTGEQDDDTVVIDYRTGQTCTACTDGTKTTVSFRWDGSKVVVTGTIPG